MATVRDRSSQLLFYKSAWWAAAASARQATLMERDCFHFRVTALLAAACAIEGFANHLISIVCPEVWAEERKFFSGSPPYVGTKGKLHWIAAQCGLDAPDIVGYASVAELLALRDALAYRRTPQFAFWRDCRVSPEPFSLPEDACELESRMRSLTAPQSLHYVESFAEALVSGLDRMALCAGRRLQLLRLRLEPFGDSARALI